MTNILRLIRLHTLRKLLQLLEDQLQRLTGPMVNEGDVNKALILIQTQLELTMWTPRDDDQELGGAEYFVVDTVLNPEIYTEITVSLQEKMGSELINVPFTAFMAGFEPVKTTIEYH